jgi:hypothetical protein
MFFLLAFKNYIGAIVWGARPSIQDEVQNVANFPLPIVTTVDAANSSLSLLSQGSSNLFHGLSFLFPAEPKPT